MNDNKELIEQCERVAREWASSPLYDEETKAAVRKMLGSADKSELVDAFYRTLEFGTGGLRGIMGPGTNRMNIYTVGAATQGLADYLNKCFASLKQISVVIGYDCRNNSQLFAGTCANIFSANGIKVYLFDEMRPTPEMSFAIRHLHCQSGIILTASHNPREYNGYKAYWDDGAQVLAPHDTGIIDEVNRVKVEDIKFQGRPELIETVGKEIDRIYLDCVHGLSIDPECIKRQKDLKIVYTPLHGTGMSTADIDKLVYNYTTDHDAIPAPLNYEGFPKSVCTSINEEVCHGIPSNDIVLEDGDIVNVDVSTIYKGYFSDASRMFIIGKTSPEKEKLVRVTKECLDLGAAAAQPFGFVGDIGEVITKHAHENGFSVVRDFCGHGVGLEFHEEPEVDHFGKAGTGMLLVPGMVFTIEPMINMGAFDVFIDEDDGWTVCTEDGLPSAQWENMIYITETGNEILTY